MCNDCFTLNEVNIRLNLRCTQHCRSKFILIDHWGYGGTQYIRNSIHANVPWGTTTTMERSGIARRRCRRRRRIHSAGSHLKRLSKRYGSSHAYFFASLNNFFLWCQSYSSGMSLATLKLVKSANQGILEVPTTSH